MDDKDHQMPRSKGKIDVQAVCPLKPFERNGGSASFAMKLAVCGMLIAAVGLVFSQTAGFQFVGCDDDRCIYKNVKVTAGLTVQGIVWAFTHQSPGISGWAPLTLLSHAAVWQCCGANAGPHHLVNVLLHAASAVILFLVLRSMTGRLWLSALVSALFAIHPLRAESVAWVTERKDVLSGLFFMLALGAYARYARRDFSFARYAAVLASFALGLLSKSTVAPLPVVLLLLDYWPLGRLPIGNTPPSLPDPSWAFARRLPTPRQGGGIIGQNHAPCPRASRSAVANARTGARKGSPSGLGGVLLCAVPLVRDGYPTHSPREPCTRRVAGGQRHRLLCSLPGPNLLSSGVVRPGHFIPASIFPCGKLLPPASCCRWSPSVRWRCWRRCPYVLVGWLWYVGTLLPACGIVEFGEGWQARGDRFTYLPQIGIWLAVAGAIADGCSRWPPHRWMLGGCVGAAADGDAGVRWRRDVCMAR